MHASMGMHLKVQSPVANQFLSGLIEQEPLAEDPDREAAPSTAASGPSSDFSEKSRKERKRERKERGATNLRYIPFL